MSWIRRAGVLLGVLLVWGATIPAGAQDQNYRIGPQDVLKVTVWGQDDLTRSVTVGPDGKFPFPLVGDVPAAGMMAAQVESRLKELLGRDYLVDPQVTVTVQEYRSQRVLVLGEAEKPGPYGLSGPTTLLDILSQAGGPSKRAGRFISVVRGPAATAPSAPGAAGGTTLRVNLQKLLEGDPAQNVSLQAGDTIYIPKVTAIFVLGEVKTQGAYTVEKDTTALEVVTLAGGFTDRSAPAGAKILRKREDGGQDTIPVDLSGAGTGRDIPLVEGDTLVVPRGNSFFVSGEVRKPGVYQLDLSTTAFGAITVAGGFTERAAQAQVKVIRRLPSGVESTTALDLSGSDGRARDFLLKDGDILVVPTGLGPPRQMFYVLGEVKSPGAYPMDGGTTAIQGIAQAGGFTDRAAPNRTKIIRTHQDGRQETLVVDLNEVIKRGRKDKDVPLMTNDVIVVPESYF